MALSDKVLGGAMVFTSLVVLTYYTLWAILLPFLDKSSSLHDFFPAREWAVRLPAFLFVVGVSAIAFFIGSTIVSENRKKSLNAHQRTA